MKSRRLIWMQVLLLIIGWMVSMAKATDAIDSMQANFRRPPNDCWPHTRWWWFGSAVTKEEITWELEQMRAKGILGVEQISMSPVYEKGNITYLSDEFLDLLRHTVATAKRLGMQVSLNFGGPGWVIGGDWVPQEDRMKDMVPTFIDVQGPSLFSAVLPKKLTQTKRSWEIHVPELDGEEQLLAVVAGKVAEQQIDPTSILLLTDKVEKDKLTWSVPAGQWRLMAFWQKYTGQGNTVDHMSKAAMHRYCDHIGGKFLKVFGEEFGKTVDSFFCDSFEVADLPSGFYWSEGLLTEFKRIKGYDLVPYLPAIWWQVGELSPKIRYDVNEFLHQVGMNAFFDTFLDWCQAHGIQGRIQPYGFTTDNLQAAGRTHLPEMEICPGEKDAVPWFDARIGPAKYTSSGAHLYGRNIVTAEVYTFIHWELYRATLEELKIASDGYLRHGANKFYNHGYCYSPEREPAPSRCMSIDANISHINTWWDYYPLLSSYIARCCYLLRQGHFAPDVALYSPLANQWTLNVLNARKWTREFDWGELGKLLIANGYDFDLINDDILQHHAQIKNNRLQVGPLDYKMLILPNVQALPLATLQFIQKYVGQGGIVVALERVPEASVGLQDYKRQDAEVRSIVKEMFSEPIGDNGTGPRDYGKGRTYHIKLVINRQDILDRRSSSLDPFVNTLRDHLKPDFGIDFATEGLRENDGLTFLHRQCADKEIYFITNIQDRPSTVPVTFRITDKIPWTWNPYTGDIAPMYWFTRKGDGIEIPLRLQPYESSFVVFEPGQRQHVVQSNVDKIVAVESSQVTALTKSNGTFLARIQNGADDVVVRTIVNHLPSPLLITGKWRLVLQSPGFAKLDTSFYQLYSWTEEARTRHFSGSGRYTLDFNLPKVYRSDELELHLDLGRVGNVAEVEVNGKKAGIIWMQGQTLEITNLVKAAANQLGITVTNTLINRVAGMKEPPPMPLELVSHYGQGIFDDSAHSRGPIGFKPLPASGLMGPVKIIAYKKIVLIP